MALVTPFNLGSRPAERGPAWSAEIERLLAVLNAPPKRRLGGGAAPSDDMRRGDDGTWQDSGAGGADSAAGGGGAVGLAAPEGLDALGGPVGGYRGGINLGGLTIGSNMPTGFHSAGVVGDAQQALANTIADALGLPGQAARSISLGPLGRSDPANAVLGQVISQATNLVPYLNAAIFAVNTLTGTAKNYGTARDLTANASRELSAFGALDPGVGRLSAAEQEAANREALVDPAMAAALGIAPAPGVSGVGYSGAPNTAPGLAGTIGTLTESGQISGLPGQQPTFTGGVPVPHGMSMAEANPNAPNTGDTGPNPGSITAGGPNAPGVGTGDISSSTGSATSGTAGVGSAASAAAAAAGGNASGALAGVEGSVGPAGGGGGGDTVICTLLAERGLIDRATVRANERFRLTRMDAATQRGYRAWAGPLVRLSRRSPMAFRVMYALLGWAPRLYMREIVRPGSSRIGRALLAVGLPVSRWIGQRLA